MDHHPMNPSNQLKLSLPHRIFARSRYGFIIFMLICMNLVMNGCGYIVGSAHQPDVQTVQVSIFESDSYRRGLEFQMTEAVQKQILTHTPYRMAKGANADTRLTGRILQVRKDLLSETGFDDARELQVEYAVEVTWEDLRNKRILAQQQFPITPELIHLVSTAEFVPEVGQSFATGNKKAIDRMARQIVQMMETPW